MDTTKRIYPAIPHWVAAIYGILAVITVPWVIYLGVTLPSRHISRHWDVAWVGMDVAIVSLLLINAYFSYKESKWLVMSATATTTMLIVDGWFDITTARPGKPFYEALIMAFLIELPLAIITFRIALRLVKRENVVTNKPLNEPPKFSL